MFQNIKLYPYNYIWLNNFNLINNVNKNFELDYWGVSTKEVANYIESIDYRNSCLISRGKSISVRVEVECDLSFIDMYFLYFILYNFYRFIFFAF